MRLTTRFLLVLAFNTLACFIMIDVQAHNCFGNNTLVNSISGQVYDPYRAPVGEVYVELQNDYYLTVSRVKTNSAGQFVFTGMSRGAYNIKVDTLGTNFVSQTQRVEVINIYPNGSDFVYVDFYLKFDTRRVNIGISGITDTIFVQDIPDKARQLFKKGVKGLKNNSSEGVTEIEQALEIFPTYFDALNTLGVEFVKRREYEKALPYLVKAVEVNGRSFHAFYSLAFACNKLNHIPEAVEAARAATILQPSSIDAQLLYGIILRVAGNYKSSETAFLQAIKLSEKNPLAEVFWQLSLVYNKLGKNKEAADQLELYIKYKPDMPVKEKEDVKNLIKRLRGA